MLHNKMLKNGFGQRFKLHSTFDGHLSTTVAAKHFHCSASATQFLRSLNVEAHFWQRLAADHDSRSGGISCNKPIFERLSPLLVNGKIRIYPLPTTAQTTTISRPKFKRDNQTEVQFASATEHMLNPTGDTLSFANRDAAKRYIASLNLDSEQIDKLAELAHESTSGANATTTSNGTAQTSIDTVCEQLCRGDIIASEATANRSNGSADGNGETTSSEQDAASASATAVPLAPPPSTAAPTEDEAEEIVCGSCTASALSVVCAHGRKPNDQGLLQIVASPNQTGTDECALMGYKVTLKKDYAGKEKLECSVSLDGNKRDDCFHLTAANGAWIDTKQNTVTLTPPEVPEDNYWPRDISPISTSIKGKGCSGANQTVTIESYPSDYRSIEGNLDIFGDWVKQVNKSWETWGKTIFDLSPVALNPKLTGPTGSFSAGWGWKEDSDWRAYYDIQAAFGLNPILGVELEISLSIMKLGLTAAGIPPTLSDLSAKHLADIILFASIGCKGMINGSPHAKLYADGDKQYDGQGKFTIEGAAKVGIKGRIGSDYVVSATLILSGETKVTGEDVLDLNSDGLFAQTTVLLDPFTAVAKVEIKYLLIFSKTEEKKWTPWQQMEIYKSDKTKVFPQ